MDAPKMDARRSIKGSLYLSAKRKKKSAEGLRRWQSKRHATMDNITPTEQFHHLDSEYEKSDNESRAMYGVENPMECRLCLLQSDSCINIFSPHGNNGLLVWRIIGDLIDSEVSLEDGLLPTICTVCLRKLMDFQQFKIKCIEARIEYQRRQTIVPIKREDVLSDDQLDQSPCITGDEYTGNDPLSCVDDPDTLVRVKEERDVYDDEVDQNQSINADEFPGNDPLGSVDDVNCQVPPKIDQDEYDDQVDENQPTNGDRYLGHDPLSRVDDPNPQKRCLYVKAECPDEPILEDWPGRHYEVTEGESGEAPKWIGENSGFQVAGVSSRLYTEGSLEMNADEGSATNLNVLGLETLGMAGTSASLPCGRETQDLDSPQMKIGCFSVAWKDQLKVKEEDAATIGSVESGKEADVGAETSREQFNYGERLLEGSENESRGNQDETSMDQSLFDIHCSNVKVEVSHISAYDQDEGEAWKELEKPEAAATSSNPSNLHIESNLGFPHTCGECNKKFTEELHLSIHMGSSHLRDLGFSCDFCGELFAQKPVLLTHINFHCGMKPRECSQCGKILISLSALKDHVRLKHKKRVYTCDNCHMSFNRKHDLKRHLASPKGIYPCDLCPQSFKLQCSLRMHKVDHPERGFPCSVCERSFNRKSHLERHMGTHTDARPYACSVCSKTFRHSCSLKSHEVLHMSGPQTCQFCSKEFDLVSSLNVHLKMHSSEYVHSCPVCHKKFPFLSGLKKHVGIHGDTEEKSSYPCSLCPKSFPKESYLKSHMVAHREQSCSDCSETFTSKGDLQQHMITAHGAKEPNSCPICFKSLSCGRNLRDHITVVHEGKKPHLCTVCGEAFSKKSVLKAHMDAGHEEERPHTCTICGRAFAQEAILHRHMTGAHEEMKPHACTICSEAFPTVPSLRKHMTVVHEVKNKIHSCTVCSKSFGTRGEHKAHMTAVHEGKKPYSCTICKKSYSLKFTLKSHMAAVHEGKRRYSCTMCSKSFLWKSNLRAHMDRIHGKAEDIV